MREWDRAEPNRKLRGLVRGPCEDMLWLFQCFLFFSGDRLDSCARLMLLLLPRFCAFRLVGLRNQPVKGLAECSWLLPTDEGEVNADSLLREVRLPRWMLE